MAVRVRMAGQRVLIMGFPGTATAVVFSSFSVTFLPLVVAIASAAETSRNDGQGTPGQLDPIVVTATLGPRTAGESLSSVTVIDEEAIRDQAPIEFKDLLRGQPGIDVVTNGSFGKSTSVYTRGTRNEGTVFLVDGIRLRSATSGSPPWQYFPVDLVERVEIVRGPRSSLYGADAVGGVIQAFTLDPEQGRQGWVEAGAGNFNTRKVSAGASAATESTRISLSGLHRETDGTAIVKDGDDKGFRNAAGVGRIAHTLPNDGEASAVLIQSEGNSEYTAGNTDFLIRALGLQLDTPVSDYWRSSVQLSESRDEQDSFQDSGDTSRFDTLNRQARWVNTVSVDVHEVVVGGEVELDEVASSTDFAEDSRTNAALFTQVRLNFGPSDLHLSLRGDDNEAFGREETGGVAFGHSFDRNHRLRLSYGTSFRAPSFNNLYYPFESFEFFGDTYTYEGNPDLQPEEGSAVEMGFSGRYRTWYWDAVLYQLDVENLIENETTGFDTRPVNVSEARIRGIELASGYDANNWRLGARLTLLDPRDRETDNRLQRRSHQSLRLDLDRQLGDWSLGTTVIAKGYRYNDAENNRRLPGFATVDLRAGWEFAPDWQARLTIANVTDRRYTTAASGRSGPEYISAGTTGFLTVRHDFR